MIPDPPRHAKTPPPSAAELSAQVDALEARLAEGERRIADATRIDADTETWEEFWIELLHSYGAVYRRLEVVDAAGRMAGGA